VKNKDKRKKTFVIYISIIKTIVLKPGPARRVNLGLEPGRVEEKIEEEKT
jgi:hypothetical protein